jgi:hypothetical protein
MVGGWLPWTKTYAWTCALHYRKRDFPITAEGTVSPQEHI